MDSKIPVPTDNIYKFYAIFGLLLFISCAYFFVAMYKTYNEAAFKRYVDMATLENLKEPNASQSAKIVILKEQNRIDKSDKEFYLTTIGFGLGISILLMVYGFYRWHSKIQPEQDKLLEMQIQKYSLEIKVLKRQITGGSFRK